ncbi:MAG TPA: hypothetical protein VG518_04130 [Solirubrobacterales bacterium]|nr:hypothetical protein [Solirubrobacterales bacterium]
MGSRDAIVVLALGAAICLAFLPSGCGGDSGAKDSGADSAAARAMSTAELRDAVLTGVAADFSAGTGSGPAGFGACLRSGLGGLLGRPALHRLLAIARGPGGAARAARALNRLAVAVGDSCGGRRYVPELIAAGSALRGVRLLGTALALGLGR